MREDVAVEKVAPPAPAPVAAGVEVATSMQAGPTDVAYLQAARAVVARTNLNGLADADLIALGKSFCQAITDGATTADFTKSASLMVVPIKTYRSLLSLTQITYCPQHIGFRI